MELADGIILEPLNQSHAQGLFDLTEANREYLRNWIPWLDTTKAVTDTEQFVASAVALQEKGDGPTFILFYRGSMCGIVGYHKFNRRNHSGGIGYWLGQDYQGKGIITQAVGRLLDLGFGVFQLNKVEICCASENHKSAAIPKRLGFVHDGTLRQNEWLYDHYVDHHVFSLLKSEYLQTRSSVCNK